MNKKNLIENSTGQGLARCCNFWQCPLNNDMQCQQALFQTVFGHSFKESVGQGPFSQGQLHMATVVLGEKMFSV